MIRHLVVPTLIALAAGCASSPVTTTKPTQQALSGTIDQQSFPAAVTSLHAIDETGVVVDVAVPADGTFRFALPPGHRYHLRFSETGGLVFPRAAGSVDADFAVTKAGAAFDLGRVRYVGDPSTTTYAFRATSNSAGEADRECEDGVDQNGAACIDDDDAECGDNHDDGECENGVDNNGAACTDDDNAGEQDDGECENGVDGSGAACTDDDTAGDGECENGVDVNGTACDDDDDDAAAAAMPSEAAVPEHNPPSDLAGCGDPEGDDKEGDDGDGEEDDD